MSHKFDVKKAAVLDDPGRKEFLNPEAILDMLDLNENSVVNMFYTKYYLSNNKMFYK